MNSDRLSLTRRHALTLSAVLTLAVGTGAAAVAGLARSPVPVAAPRAPAPPALVLPAAPAREADD